MVAKIALVELPKRMECCQGALLPRALHSVPPPSPLIHAPHRLPRLTTLHDPFYDLTSSNFQSKHYHPSPYAYLITLQSRILPDESHVPNYTPAQPVCALAGTRFRLSRSTIFGCPEVSTIFSTHANRLKVHSIDGDKPLRSFRIPYTSMVAEQTNITPSHTPPHQ